MRPLAWLAFAAVSAIWGIPYLFIEIAIDGGMTRVDVAFTLVVIGAVVLFPLASLAIAGRAAGARRAARRSRLPSAGAFVAVVVLGLVCTAAAFVIFAGLIADAGPARALVITYINPVIAVGLGVAGARRAAGRRRRGRPAADPGRVLALD
jgi:drug/metabolite transporter (DMT)-like permease